MDKGFTEQIQLHPPFCYLALATCLFLIHIATVRGELAVSLLYHTTNV